MEDKRRKSYEAFLNIFYPPRANQSQHQLEEEEEPAVRNPTLTSAVPHGVCDISKGDEEVAEEEKNSESESDSECTARNLSRSQRKRLRRKKLKQAASSRRRIIGPMLPSTEKIPHGVDNALDQHPITPPLPEWSLPETVIHNANAAEGVGAGNRDCRGEPRNVQNNKLKQRRLAKKLSRSTNNCTVKEIRIPTPEMPPAQQLPEFSGR
ncbi:hypothetical protein NE237_022388 [Protea cynaroides]|uniref:Uncharacterized protein n=1 Tax=Protea cynaroides TaxID=273540 RepID=A0A9Q0K3H2_9MAGN|nr:hypothetical protein NE237_022388 [Protea cynaroides]